MVIQTGDNKFSVAQWIVDPVAGQGTHTTISSAIASASAGETIFIRPGTYTEDPVLKADVNLVAFEGDAFTPTVKIKGKVQASYNGTATLSNIWLETNGDYALEITGANSSFLYLEDCYLYAADHAIISSNAASFALIINKCETDTAGNYALMDITATAGIEIENSDLNNSANATAVSDIASGSISIYHSQVAFAFSTSSTGFIVMYNSSLSTEPFNTTAIALTGTGNLLLNHSSVFSGTASTVSIGSGTTASINYTNISSTNTNVLTGAGTLNAGPITFLQSSGCNVSTINNTVTNPFTKSWTPTVVGSTSAGSATYSLQIGTYTRIGPLVHVAFTLNWSSGTGTGNLLIGGLPINIITTTNLRTFGAVQLASTSSPPPANTASLQVVAAGDSIANQLFIQATLDSGAATAVSYTTDGAVEGSILYYAA